jgi:adenylylsulfate kinase
MSPMLIAMAGLPGTGKSTLAAALAEALPAVVLDKDKLRAGLIPAEKIKYSRAQDDYIFELLLKAAEYNLNRGRHVILDGRTFTKRYQVERVELFAKEHKADFRIIECICPENLALQRLAGDKLEGTHPAADRGEDLFHRLQTEAETIERDHLRLNTDQDLETLVELCLEYFCRENSE